MLCSDSALQIKQRLQAHRYRVHTLGHGAAISAVSLILREAIGNTEVLLIKRAEREGDRWSGQMALPGGKAEPEDLSVQATALRETREEIGLCLSTSHYLGRLSDVSTSTHGGQTPMAITPYVFWLEGNPSLRLNHEVARTLWAPLNQLNHAQHRSTLRVEKNGVTWVLPCHLHQQEKIWGLTLQILDELLNTVAPSDAAL